MNPKMPVDVPSPPTDLPSPPFINVGGIANFRDIGGYSCGSSSASSGNESVKRNLVFRCADPSKVTPEGLDKLKELGVKKVFDLRSEPEIKREGPEWKGVEVEKGAFYTRGGDGGNDEKEDWQGDRIERIWCPVFAQRDYGPESVAVRYRQYAKNGSEGFVEAYKDILSNGTNAYNVVLSHISSPNPTPCIVHCTAGKDRTGVIVALLYLLCDVAPETISKEYSLTDDGLAHLKPLFLERLMQNPVFEGDEIRVKNMISSKAENMRATIEMIKQEYGSAEEYISKVVGLKDAQIEQLKRNLKTTAAIVLKGQ